MRELILYLHAIPILFKHTVTVLECVTCYIAISRAICRISGQSASTTYRANQSGFSMPGMENRH